MEAEIFSLKYRNFHLGIAARDSYEEIEDGSTLGRHTCTIGLGLIWFTFEFVDI